MYEIPARRVARAGVRRRGHRVGRAEGSRWWSCGSRGHEVTDVCGLAGIAVAFVDSHRSQTLEEEVPLLGIEAKAVALESRPEMIHWDLLPNATYRKKD